MNYPHQRIAPPRRVQRTLPPAAGFTRVRTGSFIGPCIALVCLLLLLRFGVGNAAWAGQKDAPLPIAPQTGRHVALVVGCQEYGENRLPTPRADAEAVAKTLKALGWDVELVEDANPAALRAALKKWGGNLDKNSVGLFYFSGLQFSHKGAAYVVPIGVSLRDAQATVLAACPSQTEIVGVMANAKSRIVILNGGRPPAFGGSPVLESLSLTPPLPPNTILAFDSKAGQSSYDVGTQALNPYAKLLITELPKSGKNLRIHVPVDRFVGVHPDGK